MLDTYAFSVSYVFPHTNAKYVALHHLVQAADSQNLKEKHEMDLKKEIKKLQRLRDQIKTWVASTEVKDKDALVEARRLIETKMETFKICEKETKTKQFSKEGLAREDKMDPEEEARLRTTSWLAEYVERFQQQVEEKDFDIEKLSAGKGKKQNKNQIEQLQKHIANHKYHITKLEGIIRLINNEVLEPDPVDSLQEDIDYYLESYQEEEYIGVYDQDFFYDSLGLDELELVNVDRLSQPMAPAKKGDDTTETSSKESKDLKNGKKAAASVIPMTIGRARSKAEKKADEENEALAAAAAATSTNSATATPSKINMNAVASSSPAPTPVLVSPPAIQAGASMAAILKRESEQQQEKERQKVRHKKRLVYLILESLVLIIVSHFIFTATSASTGTTSTATATTEATTTGTTSATTAATSSTRGAAATTTTAGSATTKAASTASSCCCCGGVGSTRGCICCSAASRCGATITTTATSRGTEGSKYSKTTGAAAAASKEWTTN
jgi:CCR4-NOT transcriptional regulation complex NOT5 subunit